MNKKSNKNKFDELFITDLSELNRNYLVKDTIILYDTCALSNHARKNLQNNSYDIFDYFNKDQLLIVTGTVLDEITYGTNCILSAQYMDFFKCAKEQGTAFALLSENKYDKLLSFKYSYKQKINEIIQNAFKVAFKDIPDKLHKNLIFTVNIKNTGYIDNMLNTLKNIPTNKGEMSILISLLVLEQIKKKNFRILTEDGKCLNYFRAPFIEGKASSNYTVESTPKIIQNLYQYGVLKEKTSREIKNILDILRTDEETKILYNPVIDGIKYDNLVVNKFTNIQLADKIYNKDLYIIF